MFKNNTVHQDNWTTVTKPITREQPIFNRSSLEPAVPRSYLPRGLYALTYCIAPVSRPKICDSREEIPSRGCML